MIKVLTILYYNDDEIFDLYENLRSFLSDFELYISQSSFPLNQIYESNVHYVGDSQNIGFGKAVNRLLPYCNDDDTVLYFNSDARIEKINLQPLIKKLDNGYVIGPHCVSDEGNVQDTFRKDITLRRLWNRLFMRILKKDKGSLPFEYELRDEQEVDWIIGGCFAIKGQALRELNGFDKRYFMYLEDQDLCLRARHLGLRILHSNVLICRYVADRKSISLNSTKDLELLLVHFRSSITFMRSNLFLFFMGRDK